MGLSWEVEAILSCAYRTLSPLHQLILENVKTIHAHTEYIHRVLGRETHILEYPVWEEESSLVIVFNKLDSGTEEETCKETGRPVG